MKRWLARAMQVSCLEETQLKKLQELEKKRNYLIANWNIQTLFSLPSLKEKLHFPGNEETNIAYCHSLEQEIIQKGWLERETWQADFSDIERMHSFDWLIFHNKSQLFFEFTERRTKKSGLMARLKQLSEEPEKEYFPF